MAEKYIFKELSSDAVVKTLKNSEICDDTISEAVIAHFSEVVGDEVSQNETAPAHHYSSFISEQELDKIKEQAFQEGYNKSAREANAASDAQLTSYKNDESLLNSINNQLTDLLNKQEPTGQYIDLLADILEEITEKLFLHLPLDFSKIIKTQLSHLLEVCYKSGKVVIMVNEKQQELCNKIIQKEPLSSKIDKIEITIDSKLTDNECIVEHHETKLVYDKALIKKEIDEITKQFRLDN